MVAYHLPLYTTHFVGRETELHTLHGLLTNHDCRLLTLAGPGGSGKTRLAVEAAKRCAEHFADGCYYVSLANVTASENLLPTLCSTLELLTYERQDARQQLSGYLSDRHLLLILDSVEHLLPEGAELISELIHNASRLHVLVTSRLRLSLVEEWVFDCVGLDLPKARPSTTIDRVGAVQLFVECARRVQIGFTLTPQNQDAVVRICELVGGMPLGLELAAAWLTVLSCAEIADEIQCDVRFLATTNRNVPEKHRSMQAVLDYSWRLLSEQEQRVFQRLALCNGFDREAAQALGAPLTMLSALVNKSLLTRDEAGRFHIHELLRQYAAERLTESPAEETQARALHGQYFAAWVSCQTHEIRSPRQREAQRALEGDLDNVLMAWEWSLSQRRYAEIRQMAPGLQAYFWNRRRYAFGAETFERAIALLEQDARSAEQEITLAVVLSRQSRLYWRPSHFAQASELARRSLALLRAHECPAETAYALWCVAVPSEDRNEQIALLRESLALCRTVDDLWLTGWVLLFLAGYETAVGDVVSALGHHQEALALARQLGDLNLLESTLGVRVEWGLVQGQYEAIHSIALEAAQASNPDHIWYAAGTLNNLGHVKAGIGNYAEAEACYRQSMSLSLEGGFKNTAMESVFGLGCLLAKCALPENAAELLACVFAQIEHNLPDENRQFYFVTPNFRVLQADVPASVLAAAREVGTSRDVMSLMAELLEAQPFLGGDTNDLPVLTESMLARAHPSIEPLTRREAEVLRLMAVGFSNRQIADELLLGISTVKTHINHLFRKLNVVSRDEAFDKARVLGLLADQ